MPATAQDPKMTCYLHQGVKATTCETTPFANTMGTQYIAARIKVELACDSIRKQGQSVNAKFGICDSQVNDVSEDNHKIAESLLAEWTDSGAPLLCAPRRFPQTCSMRVIPLSEL